MAHYNTPCVVPQVIFEQALAALNSRMAATLAQTYSDLDMTFLAHPVTGNLMPLLDRESIKQAVKILVLTNFYERPYQPFKAGHVIYHNFEHFDAITAAKVKKDIERILQASEPRSRTLSVSVLPDQDRNAFSVKIVFHPHGLSDPVTVDLILSRVR